MRTASRKPAPQDWMIRRARGLVVEAIALLDDGNAPGDIAAHLDLAVQRMSAGQTQTAWKITVKAHSDSAGLPVN